MILVDEYAALPALAGRPLPALRGEVLALTYDRTYRLTLALLGSGRGQLRVRGRFTRLVDELAPGDRHGFLELLADPDPTLLVIVDPRPLIRTASGIQNNFSMSMLQAETLAAAVTFDWPIRFADAASTTPSVRQAADELGLDLATIPA